ncbi:MAG: hypothetical protein NC037_01745 [Bacteroides sp.]|nr:hypothetical protein [Bacillota bacterium]MCM1393720.1 hypothetical protein [[Eubacterium] siraeum]MCM1455238.1 hypothetical protein [Bacteroides sp.]
MKILRGTLTFVLGMIIGIILFVVAIGGTLVILATQMTVGQIQKAVLGQDSIIASDSEIYDKTVFDAVQGVISDVQNFDKLSLKTLYEHYGIKLLNGISGIDFTNKDFYNVPIPDLINDLSIVVNSFTLNDVSKIAGVDFADYNLPILNYNLDENISTAIDNILGSLNGDLSIRAINSNFGINLGTEDNALLATLQDVTLSEFGNVMNVLRVNSILESDTDTFIPSNPADRKYFVKTDVYEAIPNSELASTTCALGVETSLIGGVDTDEDGQADRMKVVETRYEEEIYVTAEGEVSKYEVNNSSYGENFDLQNNQITFYRHIVFTPTDKTSGEDVYVLAYANRIDSVNGDDYTLVEKGFVPVDELEFTSDFWAILDDVLNDDSKLSQLEEGQTFDGITFERVHVGSSTKLLQSIAHMTISELQHADNLLEGLTIADVIEVTPDSARIIKSLAARNCKILELGTVANDLTLGEMIDIVSYRYNENAASGKYVRVEDAHGKFVRCAYYTLYNPADPNQAGLTRYDRADEVEGEASSALLQRFAGASLGGFSDAFASLMLADVMQIDADIYEEIDPAAIDDKSTERYFYYDNEKCVYRVISVEKLKEELKTDPTKTYYHITYSGETASFMKKLAYVKIDAMADAMEVVVDDMMLSEFVDVFTEDAIKITSEKIDVSPSNPLSADKKYFIEYGVGGNAYETVTYDETLQKEVTTKYVYVYDTFGDYAKANFRPVEVTDNLEDASVTFKYVKYSTLPSTDDDAFILASAPLIAQGNMYYFDKHDHKYKQNNALCAYMIAKKEYRNQVFYRESCDPADTGATTISIKKYTGTENVFVKVDSVGYFPYADEIKNNPSFADKPLYKLEKSKTNDFKDMFFIDKSEVTYLSNALNDEFISNEIYFARRKCVDVYIQIDAPAENEETFVYIDGQYIPYDSATHESQPLFKCAQGYIGDITEVSYNNGTISELTVQGLEFIRERSAAVLRTLAKGTISEMTSIITNATVGDIIEAEPGTMLDKEAIKGAKITQLGNTFKDILTEMTIGELMTWSNVNGVEQKVKDALDNVTIQALFSSLVIDTDTKEIKVNMLKIYGYETIVDSDLTA